MSLEIWIYKDWADVLKREYSVDLFLRIAGVILAVGSIMFAATMIGFNGSAGLLHLFNSLPVDGYPKYAATVGFGRRWPDTRALDFTALGSIAVRAVPGVLPDFELIDCDGVSAQVRMPQGRVVRATAGSRLAGAGEILSISWGNDGCVVTTKEGRIVAH